MADRVPSYKPTVPMYRPPVRNPDSLLPIYSRAPWRRFREAMRQQRPLCENCLAAGRHMETEEIHHLVSPREAPDRILDPTNVRALCTACHSRETNEEIRRRRKNR